MNSNKTFLLVLLVIIIAVLLYVFTQGKDSQSEQAAVMQGNEQEVMEGDVMEADVMEGEAMTGGADVMEASDNNAMEAAAGTYDVYSPEKLANAEGDVVLFFKAAWCPSCRALDADVKKNLSSLPANVTILQVDYDTATDLKAKYGVTTQHTLVQVDAKGDLVAKWSGSPTLNTLLAQIK